MKRLIKTIGYGVCLLASLLVSCDNDGHSLQPTGMLYLDVEEDASLLTKAQADVTYESLRVDIIKEETDTVRSYADYLNEVKGERLILPVGTYTVAVRSNGADAAGWETPLYQGAEEVEVKENEITNTRVVCKIANTKVSVVYSDSLKSHFIDYQTIVSNPSGSLTYTRDEYRAGYFTPEKLTVQLNLTNNDGNKFVLKKVYPDIQPQYHYTFKFTLSNGGDDTEAGSDFEVTVDKEHQEIIYDIFIREEDELFGKGEPTWNLEGAFANQTITFKKEENLVLPEAKVKLSVPNGIRSVEVKASSLQFADLPVFNEANWEAAVQKGFPALDWSATEQTLDLESLLARLEPNETQPATHTFTLTVSDNLYQEKEVTFNVVVKADVAVSAETPVVWARFAVLKGNSGDVSQVSFMMRKQGEAEFTPVTPVEKDETTGDFTALVTPLEANTTYEYYAVSGDKASEPVVTFTTEGIATLPNGGFEDWSESSGLPRPWKDGDSNPFWGCGNSSVVGVKAIMTERSSDYYAGDDGDGGSTAVYMYSKSMVGKFAAGNIFTGDFKLDGMNGVLTLGREFSARPSQLTGYYKYQPATVDNGGSQISNGGSDLCSIYIALTTEKMSIHTGNKLYFDPSSKAIVAYGELSAEECGKTLDAYTKFVINLEYRDLSVQPKYIIIVASSSKYGDYFQGGVGSKMWMDALQLVYPASLADVKLYK